MNRISEIKRETKETKIRLKLDLDGKGQFRGKTGICFFDHMLELFTKQGLFDLEIEASGDLDVEEHHLVEDVGIVLGQAFRQALGDKKGIRRYGFFILPMDETLALAAVDFSGRSEFVWNAEFKREKIGELPTELLPHFFKTVADNAAMNLHLKLFYGVNEHHKSEALFKALARAMRMACEPDERAKDAIASTKGVI
ncbi:MAG: imidazoleglycerol-phosphate dehydratase HisB [Candidatus Micrarchaeota archaeon]